MAENVNAKSERDAFIQNTLPLYHGPIVKLKVNSSTEESGNDESGTEESSTDEFRDEFEVSKDLLCARSPVFTAMLNGKFKEAQELTIELEAMEGVVSANGVAYFIKWLYLNVLEIEGHESHAITIAIELARFADLYQIAALGLKVEQIIRNIFVSTEQWRVYHSRADHNTFYLRPEHIISALNLPRGNSVRRLMAQASVEGFLTSDNYKFADLAEQYPDYAYDLLREVQRAVRSVHGNATFKDPIRNRRVQPLRENSRDTEA